MKTVGLILVTVVLVASAVALVGARQSTARAPLPPATPAQQPASIAPAPRFLPDPDPPRGAVVVEPANVVLPEPAPIPVRGSLADVDPAQDPIGWGPRPAPELDPRPFSEVHWQGLEMIPKTAALTQALRLPADVDGVLLDDVSLPADLQGFVAGDLITAVGGVPTPNLLAFLRAAERVREQPTVEIELFRQGGTQRLTLKSLFERLGTANGETPTTIPAGSRSPHQYQGTCTSCHRIGSNGTLATDQGDPLANTPPAIRSSSLASHRPRGACSSCHRVLP